MKFKRTLALLLTAVMMISLIGITASAAPVTAISARLEDYRIGEEVDDVDIEFINDEIFDEEEAVLLDKNGTPLHYGRVEAFTKYTLRVTLIPEPNVDLSALKAKNITLDGTAAKSVTPLGRRGGIVVTFALPTLTDHHLPFQDIKKADWFFDEVEYAYDHHLMSGTSSHAFGPSLATTREQMVTVIWRMHGEPRAKGGTGFKDVKKNGYSATAIAWGRETGITSGISQTKFAPKRAVTREELVTFFYRYAEFIGENTRAETTALRPFRDADNVARYARPAMRWAVEKGIVSGVTKRTINPRDTATRAQIAAILMRFEQSL